MALLLEDKTKNEAALSINDVMCFNVEIERLIKNLELLNGQKYFLSIEDVMEMTKWSKQTVQDLFNRPDFPCTDFGKRKLVTLPALLQYFSVRRCKNKRAYISEVA